jgi:hypothetical protein
MPDVGMAVHRGAANVEAHLPGAQRLEFLFPARERIIDKERL